MDRDTKETCISDSVTSCDLKKMPEMLACCTDKGCEVRNLAFYTGMKQGLEETGEYQFCSSSSGVCRNS